MCKSRELSITDRFESNPTLPGEQSGAHRGCCWCNRPDRRIVCTGRPSAVCPHCRPATRFRPDQIERGHGNKVTDRSVGAGQSHGDISVQRAASIGPQVWREQKDGKAHGEAAGLDKRGHPHTQNPCTREDKNHGNCAPTEAERRSYISAGIQTRCVAGSFWEEAESIACETDNPANDDSIHLAQLRHQRMSAPFPSAGVRLKAMTAEIIEQNGRHPSPP
jgi:hypothetical protein